MRALITQPSLEICLQTMNNVRGQTNRTWVKELHQACLSYPYDGPLINQTLSTLSTSMEQISSSLIQTYISSRIDDTVEIPLGASCCLLDRKGTKAQPCKAEFGQRAAYCTRHSGSSLLHSQKHSHDPIDRQQ